MSLQTHVGRIVPILTGHQHPDSSGPVGSETLVLENNPNIHDLTPIPFTSSPTEHKNNALPESFSSSSSPPQLQTMGKEPHMEMPSLTREGLVPHPTEGDGNCLYYSLSHQLWGDFTHAQEIREILADHIASHKDYFMQFVVARGGERRRPKRAAPSTYATRPVDANAPSDGDKERQFDEMVASTRKNGEWGSSEHLQAFCQAFKVDIRVYTKDDVQVFRDHYAGDEQRDVIRVAFWDYKHYTSVRVKDVEHKGILENSIDEKDEKDNALDYKCAISRHNSYDTAQTSAPSEQSYSTLDTSYTTHDPTPSDNSGLTIDVSTPLDIQHIQNELGGRYDRDTIVDMLKKCRGDIDRAFAALLGENGDSEKKLPPGPTFRSNLRVSRSSSPYSTGSKRSADDSDEDSDAPHLPTRRGRPRKRLISNLTMGVGISIRDDQDELVSLNLQVNPEDSKPDEEDKSPAPTPYEESAPDASKPILRKAPRRSGRLQKSRSVTPH